MESKRLSKSFASRLNHEPEVGKSLKIIGDVELQKLGVVPETIFLKTRASDFGLRSSRLHSSRRSTYDSVGSRSPIWGMNRITSASADHNSAGTTTGTPFEDLRRRLATINGSVSSVGASPPLPPRSASVSRAVAPVSSSHHDSISNLPIPSTSILDRPGSPADSVGSTTNSATFRPLSMLQGGSDGQKAAPAVGSSKANATGLLEAHSKLRSAEDSPDLSGRSSPMSMSTTLRGSERQRMPPALSISTYGMHIFSRGM